MAQRLASLMLTARAIPGACTANCHKYFFRRRRAAEARSSVPVKMGSMAGVTMQAASSTASNVGDLDSQRGKPKVIIITGATGVGKTELSLLLAESLNGEVVSADSVQVWKFTPHRCAKQTCASN